MATLLNLACTPYLGTPVNFFVLNRRNSNAFANDDYGCPAPSGAERESRHYLDLAEANETLRQGLAGRPR
jgi:hypothetical protein